MLSHSERTGVRARVCVCFCFCFVLGVERVVVAAAAAAVAVVIVVLQVTRVVVVGHYKLVSAYLGVSQNRCLTCIPVPHVLVHSLWGPNDPHPPSTTSLRMGSSPVASHVLHEPPRQYMS